MSTAVLLSGGLDSAVLLAEEAQRGAVQPIYISVGLAWEAAERAAVRLFLAGGLARGEIAPLASLAVDMTDIYPAAHWSRTGNAPAYNTPDEDVYLPGRNVILLGKAGVYCATAGVDRLLIGTLDHNPFPDATPAFRDAMASAISIGLGRRLQIAAPYASVRKAEVVERGVRAGARLALTLSCMRARGNGEAFPRHCGLCSKCRERHDAFLEARLPDPTDYVDRRFTG